MAYNPEYLVRYRAAAACYKPDVVQLLILGESPPPPRGGVIRYFYFKELSFPENLYHGVIKAVIGDNYDSSSSAKPGNLSHLKANGLFLIDAIEYSFYDIPDSQKISALKSARKDVLDRIRALNPQGVIIVHPRVHNAVSGYLQKNGVSILNTNPIDFPSTKDQRIMNGFVRDFRQSAGSIITLPLQV